MVQPQNSSREGTTGGAGPAAGAVRSSGSSSSSDDADGHSIGPSPLSRRGGGPAAGDAEDKKPRKKSKRKHLEAGDEGAVKAAAAAATSVNGLGSAPTPSKRRRSSMAAKAARDPRDEPQQQLGMRHASASAQSSAAARYRHKSGGGKTKKQRRSRSLLLEDGSGAAAAGVAEGAVSEEEVEESTRSPTPVVDFDGLSRPSVGTRERLEESAGLAAQRLERIKGAVRTILECVGEDVDREGLLMTPERYAKAMLFFTKGYQENVRDIVNGAIFHEGHNEMVIVKDIEVFSLCEHHMVPFTGKMHIGYIPNNAVIGISKLPRIAEMFARRLQVQERLTKDVANAVMEVLKPQGVAVVMESSHLCMVMRGVEKTGASTITSCVLGCFEQRDKTRNEFLSLVGLNRR